MQLSARLRNGSLDGKSVRDEHSHVKRSEISLDRKVNAPIGARALNFGDLNRDVATARHATSSLIRNGITLAARGIIGIGPRILARRAGSTGAVTTPSRLGASDLELERPGNEPVALLRGPRRPGAGQESPAPFTLITGGR